MTARWSLLLAFAGSNASPVWPPSGIALGAMLLLGYRVWPAILVGAFAANLVAFSTGNLGVGVTSIGASSAIAFGNTLEALAGVWLMRRLVANESPLDQPQNVFKFMVVVLLVGIIAASIGVVSLLLAGVVPQVMASRVWLNWWLGDVGGMVVIAPLMLAWLNQTRVKFTLRSGAEIFVTMLALCALSAIIFGGSFSHEHHDRLLVYLVIPALAWLAYRFNQAGVTLAVLLLSATAVWATIHDSGPFSTGSLNSSLILLSSFVVLFCLTGLVLAADVTQRSKRQAGPFKFTALPIDWLTLLGFLGLTIGVWHLMSLNTEAQARTQFDALAQQIKTRIDQRMQTYQQVLLSGAGLYVASKSVDVDEWHAFYQQLELQQNFPGIRGLGFARKLTDADKDNFIISEKKQRLEDYAIVPSGRREQYVVIQYIEPQDAGNRLAIGYDLYSEPVRRAALQQACDTGRATLTGEIRLRQDADKTQQAVLMVLPIYRIGAAITTVEQRRSALYGYVTAAFRMEDLMQGILGEDLQKVGLQIFNGSVRNDSASIYLSETLKSLTQGQVRKALITDLPLHIKDNVWTLHISSLPSFESGIDRQKAQLILIAGLLTSLLLFMLLRSLAVTRVTALELAQQMTSALRASEAKFRSLAESANEAIIVADAEGKIVSWNQAASRIFGYSEQEIIGVDLTRIMPERFHQPHRHGMHRMNTTGEAKVIGSTVELVGLTSDGKEFPLDLSLSTWQVDNDKFYSAIIRDVSDRKQAEQLLRDSEQRFRSIMEYAPIGMATVSLEGRWLETNDALCAIVGYSKQELVGMTFQDITHADDLEIDLSYVRQLLNNEIRSYNLQKRYIRKDGQIVWVLLAVSLMRDEQQNPLYFISQIEDITQQKQFQTKLQESELRFRLLVDNVQDYAIYMLDPTGVVMTWNTGAERSKGYSAEEIIGKNFSCFFLPEDAKAGEPQIELERARKLGFFETEAWRMRKDGSRFWANIVLTAIYDQNGDFLGYAKLTKDLTVRRAYETHIKNALAEKETLLREVYHRVKNNLQVITSLFNLQMRTLVDEQARLALQQAAERVYAMALVHEKLYQSDNLASIPLDSYIRDLCKHFSSASALGERNISIELELEPMNIDLEKAVPLGLIINELVSNSLKHAFSDGRQG